jgi:diaminohydroxyphosphoribosylaminopyrimidine deaminase / 5-amino-6-(5-phosphoribosylamino)uracil reductase
VTNLIDLLLSFMTDENYMQRCIELAKLGAGKVAPNPMVGSVLVYKDRIIGEGWHQSYGEAHAEVNCIASVMDSDREFVSSGTLYVSLEPCAHFGKTPPCADQIIKNKIPRVVIGCRDPFTEVDGKGVEKLRAAGIDVTMNVLEAGCRDLNKRFMTFHTLHRPYIVLKWAQTGNGKISSGESERLLISNGYSNRLSHRWRSQEAAILVGTNTAMMDDPELSTRLWPGRSPIRIVIDKELRLPATLKLFNGKARTIIFNGIRHGEEGHLFYYQITNDISLVEQLVKALYQLNVQSVLVEGGAYLLQSFIDAGIWDEIRRIENPSLKTENGLDAPVFNNAWQEERLVLSGDTIEVFRPNLD